jgi:DNA-binding transcriptional ArsR family regulator
MMTTAAPSAELQVLKAQFFKALAHPIRIRLLEVLAVGEASVQDLQRAVNADQPIVSQQLARLRSSGIVVTRKQGTLIYYAVADPMLAELLLVAKKILNRQLVGVQSLLEELEHESGGRRRVRVSRS